MALTSRGMRWVQLHGDSACDGKAWSSEQSRWFGSCCLLPEDQSQALDLGLRLGPGRGAENCRRTGWRGTTWH